MAVRIRADGIIVCAAMHPEAIGDTYLDDGVHYRLSAELNVLVTRSNDKHQLYGRWWWSREVPDGVTVDLWWEGGDVQCCETGSQ